MIIVFELFLNTVLFFDKIADLWLQLIIYLIFLAHLVDCLEFLFLFFITFTDFANECPHITNIVSQSDAAESFDEDQDDGFIVIGGSDISESHRQHYVRSPVIPPNILYKPLRIFDPQLNVPIFFSVHHDHQVEEGWEEVADDEIGDEHFN